MSPGRIAIMLPHGDGGGGPPDVLTTVLVLAAILTALGVLLWIGYRHDKAAEWKDDGEN